jgi:pantoate--beta-alanine ligase
MVSDLNFDIKMIIAPTVREEDGLALSSRNQYLSADERQAAPLIFKTLADAGVLIRRGESSGRKIETYIRETLDAVPQFRIDYVAVVDGKTLEPAEQISAGTMIAVAVFCGNTRLIDNIIIDR